MKHIERMLVGVAGVVGIGLALLVLAAVISALTLKTTILLLGFLGLGYCLGWLIEYMDEKE